MKITRRTFLETAGAAGVCAALSPLIARRALPCGKQRQRGNRTGVLDGSKRELVLKNNIVRNNVVE